MILDLIIAAFLIVGSLLVFLAAVGLVRMPDIYSRCHTSSKASTLGKIFPFLAVSLFFMDFGIFVEVFLIVWFFFMTSPVATHLLTRAAHRQGVKQYSETLFDDYKDV